MSLVNVNKIAPSTGTTVTLGDASDVFQLPASAEIDIASGATLDINGTVDFAGATVNNLSAGKILQVVVAEAAEQTSYINSTSWSDTGGMSVSITPSSASNNIIVHVSDTVYIGADGFHLYRLYETANSATICEALMGTHNGTQFGESVGLVGYYNPTNTNELTFKTYMRRLDGSAQSRMRDSQIESSSNVFRLIAMEVEG
tara:strand:+ start:294 stop:896 length:603 start_codon:yes stop_codon:yes gene_type:complete